MLPVPGRVARDRSTSANSICGLASRSPALRFDTLSSGHVSQVPSSVCPTARPTVETLGSGAVVLWAEILNLVETRILVEMWDPFHNPLLLQVEQWLPSLTNLSRLIT
jgi:hypothetical protein